MRYSTNQYRFIVYLLERIGFNDYEEKKIFIENFREHHGNSIIEKLISEIQTKMNLGNIKLKNNRFNNKISASDLSTFYFCPVSYSIKKSFVIEEPINPEELETGINLHETLRLVDKKIRFEDFDSDISIEKVLEEGDLKTINKIKDCKLIYTGHTNEKVFFENKEKNYIGQPDYIFRDPNGKYFVVEEKFKHIDKCYSKEKFFSNDRIQLQSYIEFIKEYKIEYGVLIYWFYEFWNDGLPYVHEVSIEIIKSNKYSRLLNGTLNNLNNFLAQKKINPLKNVDKNKCISCSVNRYCFHKIEGINNLKFPYNKYDMEMEGVEFLEEIKKLLSI